MQKSLIIKNVAPNPIPNGSLNAEAEHRAGSKVRQQQVKQQVKQQKVRQQKVRQQKVEPQPIQPSLFAGLETTTTKGIKTEGIRIKEAPTTDPTTTSVTATESVAAQHHSTTPADTASAMTIPTAEPTAVATIEPTAESTAIFSHPLVWRGQQLWSKPAVVQTARSNTHHSADHQAEPTGAEAINPPATHKPNSAPHSNPHNKSSSGSSKSLNTLPSGFAELDEHLWGGGWPGDGLVELLMHTAGMGEVQLLLPSLRKLNQQRWIIWINPPFHLYAPALAQAGVSPEKNLVLTPKTHADFLWMTERACQSGSCGAVLAWPFTRKLKSKDTRRLQLASKRGSTLTCLFRPRQEAQQPSMAELRLSLQSGHRPGQLHIDIVKRRGGWPLQNIAVCAAPQMAQTDSRQRHLHKQIMLWRDHQQALQLSAMTSHKKVGDASELAQSASDLSAFPHTNLDTELEADLQSLFTEEMLPGEQPLPDSSSDLSASSNPHPNQNSDLNPGADSEADLSPELGPELGPELATSLDPNRGVLH